MTATSVDAPDVVPPPAPPASAGSARRRFVFTLVMNFARTGISFATTMLAARWLGPGMYGNMAFLLGTFAGLRAALDMGSSAAFFTFLSQQPRSRVFVRRFLVWLVLQFLAPALAITVILPSEWARRIWHSEPLPLILLAFAAAFLQGSVWPVVQQMCESQRRTYLAQGLGVAVVSVHLVAVACFWWFGVLGLTALLAAVAIEYVLAATVALRVLKFPAATEAEPLRTFIQRFVTYCLPLVPFAAVSFGNEFVDRWMLQQYGGGVQQAYYSVSAQLASIALIATTSILNIFWKEIAEAHHRQDRVRTQLLYRRVSRLLFFAGAAAAGFLMPWAGDLLRVILGPAYVAGAAALMIMLLYPVHQTMGQIGATMLYATERVGVQVVIGVAVMCLAMITTYFVLAPSTNRVPGLGLASAGLAIKMVAVQIVSVNVLAFAIARMNTWKFDWSFQPLAIGICVGAGWLAYAAINAVMPSRLPLLVRLLPAGLAYGMLVVLILSRMPALIGLSRDEFRRDVSRGVTFLRRRPSR